VSPRGRGRSRPRWLPAPGTLATTVLIALAVPPLEFAPLIWVAFVPWLAALEGRRSVAETILQGLWLDFLLGFASTFWVAAAVPRYLGASWAVGGLALVVHAAIHQLQFAAFAGIVWWRTRATPARTLAHLVLLALLYTGIDWAMPKIFRDTIGIALHDFANLRQLAAFGGTPLLTFLVMVVNLGLFAVYRAVAADPGEPRDRWRAGVRPGLRIGVVFAACYALALFESARVDRWLATPARVVQVGFVQGNVNGEIKKRWARGDADAARAALDVYWRATERLLAGGAAPDFVVWPETTYPGIFRKPEHDAQLLLNVAFDRKVAAAGVPLVFGAYDREDRADRRVLQNALYVVEPLPGQAPGQLSPMRVYHKSMLLPIGEYVPGLAEDTVRAWFPRAAHFAHGDGPQVLPVALANGGRVRIGPAICYEDLFPDYAAETARKGAELLVNISNDSWLGDLGAARFHLIFARLRSIETRLPQLRVTNSGYSALILPNGELRHATAFGVESSGNLPVPLFEGGAPLRVRWGDWFGPASLALGLGSLLWIRQRE